MEQKPPHPLDIIIGSQLRLRRKMMGMSQVLLAQRVGITFQQIQKYELGRNSISARRLFELAQLLGVSPMYFYDAYANSVTVMPDALTTQAIHLVQDYTSIRSITVRNSIAAFVREVAKEHRHGA